MLEASLTSELAVPVGDFFFFFSPPALKRNQNKSGGENRETKERLHLALLSLPSVYLSLLLMS